MTSPLHPAPPRRRYLALAVTLAAAVASAASLDEAEPTQYPSAASTAQVTVLTPSSPTVTKTVQVTALNQPLAVELTVSAQVTWAAGAGGGAGGLPVVTATLGPDQGNETEGGVPPDDAGVALGSPWATTLAVAAGQPCGVSDTCTVAFTLTLSQALPAEDVTLTWTAVATVAVDGNPPTITVTVTP